MIADHILITQLGSRVESFFSEMAILWGLLRYTAKGQKFWPYGFFKAARPKRPINFRNQVWPKMLSIVLFSENAKIAKKIQKLPG